MGIEQQVPLQVTQSLVKLAFRIYARLQIFEEGGLVELT